MKKSMKAAICLQIIYCIGCGTVLVCMPLYTTFYTTTFGEICFRIGTVMAILSARNPVGVICGIMNLVGYFSWRKESDLKPARGVLIWVVAGPVLTTICWYLSICSFVYHSGGV